MTALFTPTEPAEPPVFIVVWDVASCMGRVAPATVERRHNGIVRLRVGNEVLLLGQAEVEERQRLAVRARVQEARERARQGGPRG